MWWKMETKTITQITKQKQNPKRYNIYLNDEYSFSVHEDVLVSNRLLKGKEIDEITIKNVLEEEEKNKIWQRALKYISYRPRTAKEVREHLLHQDYEPEIINIVMDKLQQQDWINDSRYAQEFTKQRIKLKPRGKKQIAQELKLKGIPIEEIELSLKSIDYNTEYQMAIILASKKYHQLKDKDWQTIQRKIGSYLQRKGFSFDVIHDVFHQLKEDENKSTNFEKI